MMERHEASPQRNRRGWGLANQKIRLCQLKSERRMKKELLSKRDKLLDAIYQGVLTVKAGDKTVTYKSNREMRDALASIDEEIAALEGKIKVKRILTYARNGL